MLNPNTTKINSILGILVIAGKFIFRSNVKVKVKRIIVVKNH
jgi:hypothetical protein